MWGGEPRMCSNTKKKIAQALRRLMNERPFEKITVQNLMDMAQMKRQSFYYHFQDTRDVLIWLYRQEVIEPLQNARLPFVDWVLLALELLNQDRYFYRQMLNAAHTDCFREFAQVLEPRMLELLYPNRTIQQLSDHERFALDFATQAACARVIRFVHSRDTMDPVDIRGRIEYLVNSLTISQL